MRVSCVVAIAGVLFSIGAARAQAISDNAPEEAVPQLIMLVGMTAPPYKAPVPVTEPKPDYSRCPKVQLMQLVFKLDVDKKGVPGNIEHVNGPPNYCVGAAAETAVHKYRFTPGQENGSPALTHILLAVQTEEPASQNGSMNPSPSSGKTRPVLLNNSALRLPPKIQAANPTAKFKVSMTIDERGFPHDMHAVDAENKEVGDAVVKAMSQYRFWPAMEDGRAVKTVLQIEISLQSFP